MDIFHDSNIPAETPAVRTTYTIPNWSYIIKKQRNVYTKEQLKEIEKNTKVEKTEEEENNKEL